MKYPQYLSHVKTWFEQNSCRLKEEDVVTELRGPTQSVWVDRVDLELSTPHCEATFVLWDDGNAEIHRINWNTDDSVKVNSYRVQNSEEITILIEEVLLWMDIR